MNNFFSFAAGIAFGVFAYCQLTKVENANKGLTMTNLEYGVEVLTDSTIIVIPTDRPYKKYECKMVDFEDIIMMDNL